VTIDELIANWPINEVAYGDINQLKSDIKLLITESAKSGNNMSVDQLTFVLATAYNESKIGRDMDEGGGSQYNSRRDLCN
jgi:hypothetical protein